MVRVRQPLEPGEAGKPDPGRENPMPRALDTPTYFTRRALGTVSLRELAEVLAAVQYREDPDRVGVHLIDHPIRPLDQLADLSAVKLRHDAARVRKSAGLLEAVDDAVHKVLGVDRRGETDVLGDGGELGDGVLRPAELAHYEARRIRARMRASASSWLSTRPSAASASPASTDCRT